MSTRSKLSHARQIDIVPYTTEEAHKLGEVLGSMGVPCFGPTTGLEILKMVERLDGFINTNKALLTPDMVAVLNGLRSRLTDVCNVVAGMQGEAIKRLEGMLKGR